MCIRDRGSGYDYRVTDPVNGDASNWLVQQGVPAFFVLLRDYAELNDSAWNRNLDGINDTLVQATR